MKKARFGIRSFDTNRTWKHLLSNPYKKDIGMTNPIRNASVVQKYAIQQICHAINGYRRIVSDHRRLNPDLIISRFAD